MMTTLCIQALNNLYVEYGIGYTDKKIDKFCQVYEAYYMEKAEEGKISKEDAKQYQVIKEQKTV